MPFNFQSIRETVESYAEEQPYKVFCYECGKSLDFKTDIDGDLDISVYVNPCECVKET